MNLTENYITSYGYDYFENAAEDTLVYFVYDDDAPNVESSAGNGRETITNVSGETVNGASTETNAVNTNTHAEAYSEKNGDRSTNFNIEQDSATSDNEYGDAPASGSLSKDSDADDEFNDSIPKMQPIDEKQTEVKPASNEAGLKN